MPAAQGKTGRRQRAREGQRPENNTSNDLPRNTFLEVGRFAMNQAKDQDSQRLQLANHLKLTEDLWQKLYYVKWNPKSFAMLARLAQEMLKSAQTLGDDRLINLTAQLEHHVKICVTAGTPPHEAERQRLTALLDALRYLLATGHAVGAAEDLRTRPAGAATGNLPDRPG